MYEWGCDSLGAVWEPATSVKLEIIERNMPSTQYTRYKL